MKGFPPMAVPAMVVPWCTKSTNRRVCVTTHTCTPFQPPSVIPLSHYSDEPAASRRYLYRRSKPTGGGSVSTPGSGKPRSNCLQTARRTATPSRSWHVLYASREEQPCFSAHAFASRCSRNRAPSLHAPRASTTKG